MMGKRIITISREFGSGGRFIGMEVAQKLGVKYYDKEMIGQIAEQSGFSPKYIQENAELSPKKGLFAYAFSGRDQYWYRRSARPSAPVRRSAPALRAAPWNHQNESFQLQLADRLTDRGAADAQLLCQLNLHQALARCQLSL